MRSASPGSVAAALVLATLAVASPAGAEDRKPVRLIAEAEDFAVRRAGWEIVPYRENYFASTFAISFLSRMACLGAPGQVPQGAPAIAQQTVDIPYADDYQVLVRYEQPFNFSAEFTVEIVQGRRTVFSETYGRLQDPKIWPLNGHKRVAMERFFWGGTDNIVWQSRGAASLRAGRAVIRLVAGAQLDGNARRRNAGRRNVDVVCLTNDAAGMEAQKKTRYLEFDGWLVQDGDLFVRITNPADGAGPCVPVIAPFPPGQHSPYYVHVRDWVSTRVLKSGRLTEPTDYRIAGPRSAAVAPKLLAPELDWARFAAPQDPKRPEAEPKAVVPDDEYLQPGDTSGWVPMGQVVDALNSSQWFPQATYGDRGVKEMDLGLEFAVPDGRGGLRPVKRIRVKGKGGYYSPVTFEIPGNVAPSPALAAVRQARYWAPVIRTQKEALDWLNARVAAFPKKGSRPRRFLIYNILGFSGAVGVFPEARELALALGDNTTVGQEGSKRGLRAHWRNTNMDWVRKQDVSDVRVVSYGDEIHLPSAGLTDEELAAALKARGVEHEGPVRFTRDRNDPLFYYSVVCGTEAGAKPFVEASAHYAARGALTGANYSPHSNYLVTEMHYVRPFKLKALTMPWSEDYVWQIPEFSVQVVGYLTSAFRAGAKYHDMPIHMYVMPHSPGNTPRDFRLSFYTTVAHGTKMVNYFCASPSAVGGTENYVATDDLAMWRQIHDCSHEAGAFEDYVMDGKVRRARVGLVLSSVDDVMTGATNATFAMHNNERKAVYYALRHSQVPVDFLSEDDVVEGLADDYVLIYVTQRWLHSRAVAALRKWVEGGGTLVSMCGGGFRNEFDRPNPEANGLYGVRSQEISADPHLVDRYLLEENRPFLTKQDLPLYEPMDSAGWAVRGAAAKDVPVIVWKQTMTLADGEALGRFSDGSPALVRKTHGKGAAYLFGFLPGQAYLKSGLPALPPDRGSTDAAFAHFLPTDMEVDLRRRIVDDFLPEDFVRPVETSVDLVEATCIDTPAAAGRPPRLAVTLVNFTGRPVERLAVRIAGLDQARLIRSVERGELEAGFRGGHATVELPLDVADMLLIDR